MGFTIILYAQDKVLAPVFYLIMPSSTIILDLLSKLDLHLLGISSNYPISQDILYSLSPDNPLNPKAQKPINLQGMWVIGYFWFFFSWVLGYDLLTQIFQSNYTIFQGILCFCYFTTNLYVAKLHKFQLFQVYIVNLHVSCFIWVIGFSSLNNPRVLVHWLVVSVWHSYCCPILGCWIFK